MALHLHYFSESPTFPVTIAGIIECGSKVSGETTQSNPTKYYIMEHTIPNNVISIDLPTDNERLTPTTWFLQLLDTDLNVKQSAVEYLLITSLSPGTYIIEVSGISSVGEYDLEISCTITNSLTPSPTNNPTPESLSPSQLPTQIPTNPTLAVPSGSPTS